VTPAFQYPSSPDVVIGGTVVHDPTLPAFEGRYLYGRFNSGLKLLGARAAPPEADGPDIAAVSAVGTDGLGRLYATSLAGGLYRLSQNGVQLGASKVRDFDQPVALAAPPGDPERLFVVENRGGCATSMAACSWTLPISWPTAVSKASWRWRSPRTTP
jgi:hypothetical protein